MLLMTSTIVAQRAQGKGWQPQNKMHGKRELPKFNAENAIGILMYDFERVLKKTKIKKAKKKSRLAKIISDYNHTIAEIKFLHSDDLRATENFVALKRAIAMTNRDRDAMHYIQQETMEKLTHIKHKVRKAERVLNNKLTLILSEKQYHKWNRFQRKSKESLKPKRPDNSEGRRPKQGGPRGR